MATYELTLQHTGGSEVVVEQEFDQEPELGQTVFAEGRPWHVFHKREDCIICWPGALLIEDPGAPAEPADEEMLDQLQAAGGAVDEAAPPHVPRGRDIDTESLNRDT